jgi:hypothetical protein
VKHNVLKKSARRIKRPLFIWVLGLCALACLAECVLSPYLSLSVILNMHPFVSSATESTPNFYGENIDMSQILPASQHYIVNSQGQDLIDIAAQLGVNLVRITNGQRSFQNTADSIYTKAQWNQVLDKLQSKGIKAIILIEVAGNNPDYYTPDIQPVYLHLVQEYLNSGVFSNPDVYAVDIKNEPLLTATNISMLDAAHAMIKAQYPDLKQTVGWWAGDKSPTDPYNPNNYNWSDFSGGQKIANIVDFFSIHMYSDLASNNLGLGLNPDLKTKLFLSQVENGLQTTKPILIEEFGEANGDAVSDQDTIGSPQLQANIYQGVYQALKEMHTSQIIGAVAYDFYSRNQYPDAWSIVKDNGNYLFPAAYILQEYALGKSNAALQTATVVRSQSYLLTNTNNHTTQNLHVSDRIGLKLQLDDRENYSLHLSQQGILQPSEIFRYDSDTDAYYAVYQATSTGQVQLTIVANTTDSAHAPPPTYTITINVQ